MSAKDPEEPRDARYRDWVFTIPNIICFARIVGSVALLILALFGQKKWFVASFIVLNLSDWIDGWLARTLHQRSELGARIDSVADAALYGALLLGSGVLCWPTISHELWWLAAPIASFAASVIAGFVKFGKAPSYHTLAAKRSQPLVLIAAILLLLFNWVWPMRIACLAVTFTNLEALALTLVLQQWQADIPSFRSVVRAERSGNQRD